MPVSSEGINTLILLHFFDKTTAEAISISLWLHLGTVLAATVYFRKEVAELVLGLPQYMERIGEGNDSQRDSMITFLIVATLLTGALGAPLLLLSLEQEDVPAGTVMAIIGGLLIVTGLIQRFARKREGSRTKPRMRDSVLLGVVQSFAAFPGLSRSGLTLSALVFRGFEMNRAIRMSFLMSIPVVFAAEVGLAVIGDVTYDLAAMSGVVAAFVFGILTIGSLLRIATRVAFWKFLIFLGAISILPLLIPD